MEELKYSDYAIVFNWEIINDEPDIGKWEMLFEESGKKIEGKNMSDFIETLSQLDGDVINVIYVKNLNLLEVIGESYFSYGLGYQAGVKEGQINFFKIRVFNNVEFRNWDNWENKVDDCEEFLRRLNFGRENFKGQLKNKLNLKAHYTYTKARDQFNSIVGEYYLTSPWAQKFREDLLPQDQNELDLMNEVYKASYYFTNPKFIKKTINNVISCDISSSHSGFMLRKKYPSSSSITVNSVKEIMEIVNKGFYAWIGEFEFVGLKEKVKLPIDLRKFGYLNDDDNWVLILTSAHWPAFKRLFGAENIIPYCFYYYEQKELMRNYANMINQLYEEKQHFKKSEDPYISSIFKFRTELPFGQSIKSPIHHQAVMFNEEKNTFEKFKLEKPSFDEVVGKLKRYAIPYQIGIWTAAYSWAEVINMILDIGMDNIVYADTDCVKFMGEEFLDVIEKHNKEIDQEVNKITKKRNLIESNKKLGRWQYEGTYSQFKAIGVKWYLYELNGELEVKAAGADCDKLVNWLKEKDNPFEFFNKEDINVKDLFRNVYIDRKNGVVHVGYNNYMSDELAKELNEKTNGFYI